MIDITPKEFNENLTYQAYDMNNVYKCDVTSIISTIEQIRQSNKNDKCLIQIPNTNGLTHEIINQLPDNVDVRIVGGYTEEYAKSVKNPNMNYLREKATYSKDELNSIVSKIEDIESHIDPNWNQYEKALYLYEYMKNDIVYREPQHANDIGSTWQRTRTWDTLIGMTNQLSTCNGYSHIYSELCNRQGIECHQVAGNGGNHAWNIVTIDNKNFIVDIIWDSIDIEKGIDHTTHFGSDDTSKHRPSCYIEQHQRLSTINQDWIEKTKEKVSKNIPKDKIVQEKLDNYLKSRDQDRKRMLELREKMVQHHQQEQMLQSMSEQEINNTESYGGRSL